MSLRILFLVFVSITNCTFGQQSDMATVESNRDRSEISISVVKEEMVYHPQTFYVGDYFYAGSFLQNLGNEAIRNFPLFPVQPSQTDITVDKKTKLFLSTDSIEVKYEYIGEGIIVRDILYGIKRETFNPGDILWNSLIIAEFPPLDDLKHPFWVKFLEDIPIEGRKCRVTLLYPSGAESHCDIVILPRPNREMQILEEWYANTPNHLFPVVHEQRHMKLFSPELRGREDCIFILDGVRYYQYAFLRPGNRKPAIPNLPKSMIEWKALENSFTQSTMRDEITLSKLYMEYITAEKEKEETAISKLVEWLNSLPRIQRIIMVHNLEEITWVTYDTRSAIPDSSEQIQLNLLRKVLLLQKELPYLQEIPQHRLENIPLFGNIEKMLKMIEQGPPDGPHNPPPGIGGSY